MQSGDGLLVRIRPPLGIVHAPAARALAAAVARYGNGVLDIGRRGSLQIRGLEAASVAPFAAEVVSLGLAHIDPNVERRRNVMISPLADDDPDASRDAIAIAASIETLITSDSRLSLLPAKFGILVDAGGVLPIAGASADIRVMLRDKTAYCSLDGSPMATVCDPAVVADAVLRLTVAFTEFAEPVTRMRALVEISGARSIFARAKLHPTTTMEIPEAPAAVGWLGYAQGGVGAFGIGLPFGATDAATFGNLASVAEEYGDATLRMAPWRNLVIANVRSPHRLQDALSALDVIVSPNDRRLAAFACPGMPSCSSGTVPTRSDAAQLAGIDVGGSLHVSGCAKGCAHSEAAALTLVGQHGRYAVVRNGRASDPPSATGLSIRDVISILAQSGALS
jgi:precorrin-3B synthase